MQTSHLQTSHLQTSQHAALSASSPKQLRHRLGLRLVGLAFHALTLSGFVAAGGVIAFALQSRHSTVPTAPQVERLAPAAHPALQNSFHSTVHLPAEQSRADDQIPVWPNFVALAEPAKFDSAVVPCQQLEIAQREASQHPDGMFGWNASQTQTGSQPVSFSPSLDGVPCEDSSCGPMGVHEFQTERWMLGVDQQSARKLHREPGWSDQKLVPWESFGYGEYIGPFRAPHVAEYRLRIRDQIDFTYTLTREHLSQPYQVYAGDTLQLFSGADASLNQKDIVVLSDGTISLPLVGRVRASGKTVEQLGTELDKLYSRYVKTPAMIVQVTKGDTPANDLINAVVARVGLGGQQFNVEIAPDGTVALPLIGQVPAIGLTLRELAREVNARYATSIRGLNVTPVLRNRAPRSVFVLGEVVRPGRIQIEGPTTVMQAISMAEGWRRGSNLRQIVVFRRDQDWRLMATRIDLQGALLGKSPYPADEIWLRDSDIVLVPKTPILRASEAVDLYMSRTLYAIFPQQGVVFNFDNFQTF
ncbi:MAG: polysaccharide biosynthesis/export family protein [Planctomycetota bacterium]